MAAATNNCSTKEPSIDFKVIYNKKKYDVTLPLDTDIGALKTHLHPIIDIPPAMMKVKETKTEYLANHQSIFDEIVCY